jgi:hypothetical protein
MMNKTKILFVVITLAGIVGIFSIRDINYPFDGRTAYDHGFELGSGYSIKAWNTKYKDEKFLHVHDQCNCLFFKPHDNY